MSQGTNTLPPFSQISEVTPNQLAKDAYSEGPHGPGEPRVERQPAEVAPSLSLAQQQVWLHAQLAPDVPLCEVLILERTGPLDHEALELSLSEISRRHEVLRTTFPVVDGTAVPAVAEPQTVKLALTELNDLPDGQRATEVLRIATEEARRPFDLANCPLMRTRLLRFKQDYVLIVTLHTLVADEWSLNILARELDALYQAYAAGEPSPLPELPVQYADWAHGQKTW